MFVFEGPLRVSAVTAAALLFALATPVRGETVVADSVLIRLIDQVDVPARAAGALEEILVREGSVVGPGERLGRIDITDAELERRRAELELKIAMHEAEDDVAIRSAQRSLDFAQAHFQRLVQADRAQPRSVSESELEKARLDAEQAEFELQTGQNDLQTARMRKDLKTNALALAEHNVDIREITAPLEGTVVDVQHQIGEWVEPGEKLFRIVSTGRVRAEGFVAARQASADLKGSPVRVVLSEDAGIDEVFEGTVVFVSPEIDPINGQVRIWAEVENRNGLLRPGLRARMSITVP